MPHIWISLIYSKQRANLSTRLGPGVNRGRVQARRWEWGIGKGQWKRAAKRAARELGMEGQTRAIYLVVVSRYSVKYDGTKYAANQLYESIR